MISLWGYAYATASTHYYYNSIRANNNTITLVHETFTTRRRMRMNAALYCSGRLPMIDWLSWEATFDVIDRIFHGDLEKLDAFHQWCLWRLVRPSYLRHVTNGEVLHLTCQTQLSTTMWYRCLRFLVISRGRTAEWIILVLFDPLFLDFRAIGNDLPVDKDELGRPYYWTGLAATQHRLGVSLATGSGSWTVETDSENGYAPGWGMFLMMMIFQRQVQLVGYKLLIMITVA